MDNAFSDLGRGLGYTTTETPQPVNGVPGSQSATFTSNDPQAQAPPNNASTSGGATAPTMNLASGVGQILLFPGKTIVSQFVGVGDPLDTSHLPITILLSAAAWYAAYWWFFQRHAK